MVKVNDWLRFRRNYLKDKKNFEGYYVCDECGRWTVAIELHHIKPRSTHEHLTLEPTNIQMLCHPCHQRK